MPELTTASSNHLLYVLSARREMSWRAFKEVFDSLSTTGVVLDEQDRDSAGGEWEGRFARRQTTTVLDALAHCDFAWEEGEGRVYVAPAVLARLPRAGLPQAVLCGTRSPQTHAQLGRACAAYGATVEWAAQPLGVAFVPPRVVVQTTEIGGLEAVARALGITCSVQPPAWKLLHLAGSLDDTLANCRWGTAKTLNWRRRDFDIYKLQFTDRQARGNSAQLIRYTHPRRQTRQHYVVRDGQSAAIDLDWGRYAVLQSASLNVLAYNERSFHLAVPSGAPLPRLLARSLALCSGFAPQFLPREAASWSSPESRGFNVYRWIPPQIADMVAAKLGQGLLEREIRPT